MVREYEGLQGAKDREAAAGVELARGRGYWYFHGGIADSFYEQSVHVVQIKQLSLDRWLETFRHKVEDARRNETTTTRLEPTVAG